MRQGIKRGSPAAINSRHARVADRPLVLTDDGEQTLPKPGGRTGRMGPKKIPSFNTDTTPRRAKQTASTEIVRGARLALAERVLGEMYSNTVPKGSKAARDLSNIEGMRRIVQAEPGGAQKTAKVLRTSVDKVLNPPKKPKKPKKPTKDSK
mgnify:CR=1 FL=1